MQCATTKKGQVTQLYYNKQPKEIVNLQWIEEIERHIIVFWLVRNRYDRR